MLLTLASLAALAETASEEGGAGITPFLVGGGALLLLLAVMLGLLAFGKGREHS